MPGSAGSTAAVLLELPATDEDDELAEASPDDDAATEVDGTPVDAGVDVVDDEDSPAAEESSPHPHASTTARSARRPMPHAWYSRRAALWAQLARARDQSASDSAWARPRAVAAVGSPASMHKQRSRSTDKASSTSATACARA